MESRFVGCLLGGAVGDALGMPFEGMSRREIFRLNGDRVIDFLPGKGLSPGSYTDDTQLALALAKSIVETQDFDPRDYAVRIQAWRDAAVAPSFTCLWAALRLASGISWRASGLGSAGCGSATRAAPIGLLDLFRPRKLQRDAEDSSRITHTDDRAITGTIAVAYAVSQVIRDPDLRGVEFLTKVRDFVGHTSPEFYEKLSATIKYDGMRLHKGLEFIGTSGYVVETVISSLFLASQSSSFGTGVLEAVNAGGDTDSIGAVTGAILGAKFGTGGIPLQWREGVQDSERLRELGESVYRVVADQ